MQNDAVRGEQGERDRLLQLELRIARRADELARQRGPGRDLELWLEAEREVLVGPTDPETPLAGPQPE